MKFIEETLKENPKIKYIGLFGSRSRGNNFLNSDVDLVLLGTLSEDIKEIEDKAVLEFNAPKADIYLLKRESIEHPTVNPKTVTMGLDLIELYRDKDENEVSLNIGELDSKWFCSFLEYERLRTLEIFYDKEATPDYIKKMPGGRRSYDEIIWLSKLAKTLEEEKLTGVGGNAYPPINSPYIGKCIACLGYPAGGAIGIEEKYYIIKK